MCFDPISFATTAWTAISSAAATVAPALPYVAGGAAALGALQQGAAADTAGRQQQAESEFNARQFGRAAEERARAGAVEQDRLRTRQRLQAGQGRANAAASGLALEGSPLEVLAFNAGEQAKEMDALLTTTGMETRDLYTQSSLERQRGLMARRAGGQARQASYVRAGTALLSTAGRWGR